MRLTHRPSCVLHDASSRFPSLLFSCAQSRAENAKNAKLATRPDRAAVAFAPPTYAPQTELPEPQQVLPRNCVYSSWVVVSSSLIAAVEQVLQDSVMTSDR